MCRACLQQWATVTNLCPLCKKRFTHISTGKISISVPDRQQSILVDDDEDLAAIEALIAEEEEYLEMNDEFIAPEGQIWSETSRRRPRRRLRSWSGAELNGLRSQEVPSSVTRSVQQAFRRRILSDDDSDDDNDDHDRRQEMGNLNQDDQSPRTILDHNRSLLGTSQQSDSIARNGGVRIGQTEFSPLQETNRLNPQSSPVYSWPTPPRHSNDSGLSRFIRSAEQSPFFSFRRQLSSPIKKIPKISIVKVFEERIQKYGSV